MFTRKVATFIVALGLIAVFSCKNAYGMKKNMKRKLSDFEDEHENFQSNKEMNRLQKQSNPENQHNRVELCEQVTLRRIDQVTLNENNNNNNNIDVVHEALFDQVMGLVTSQADLNEQDTHGNTLLHRAVLGGYQDIVELLVNNGADCTKTNENGETPFALAMNNDQREISRFLMDNDGACF